MNYSKWDSGCKEKYEAKIRKKQGTFFLKCQKVYAQRKLLFQTTVDGEN
jgi:hypothetical protein